MLGEKIRKLRKRAGLTQPELGKRVGRTKGTISRWEKQGDVPDTMLSGLAEALGVELSALTGHLDEDDSDRSNTVQGHEAFTRWFNALSQSGINTELFVVLIAIAGEASTPPWVASVSFGHLLSRTPLSRDLLERMWPQVLESEWLERRGSGEWTFILKFPD